MGGFTAEKKTVPDKLEDVHVHHLSHGFNIQRLSIKRIQLKIIRQLFRELI